MNEDLTNKTKEILSKTKGFIANNNYEVIEVSEHYCKLIGNVNETSLNHLNICHGGYLYGLLDTAGGIAAMSDMRVVVTVSSSINFLKQAKGNKIYAEAKKIKAGKKISVFEINAYDEEKNLLCTSLFTYMYMD